MAWFRLIDCASGKALKTRRMDTEVAEQWNADLDLEKQRWVLGLSRFPRPAVKSLAHVLRSLDSEGFDDHTINTIELWLSRRAKEAVAERKRSERHRHRFAEFMREQIPESRKIVSRFISNRAKHAFEAGLRAGLAAYLVKEHEALLGDSFGGPDDTEDI